MNVKLIQQRKQRAKMASLKAEKPAATQGPAQGKKEPTRAGGSTKAAAKQGAKKSDQKATPKKKVCISVVIILQFRVWN